MLAGLCLLSVVCMVLPVRYARWPSRALRPALAPIGDAGMYLTTRMRGRLGELTGREAEGPEDVVHLNHALLQTLEQQRRELGELRRWRGVLGDEFLCRLVPARVVGVEPLPLRDRRVVSAGADKQVRGGDLVTTRRVLHPIEVALPPELAVLGRNAVVGRILDPAAHTATLQLVTDPSFSMPGQLWRMVGPGQKRTVHVEGPREAWSEHTDHNSGAVARPAGRLVGRAPGKFRPFPSIPVRLEGDGRQIALAHVPEKHRIAPGDFLTTDISELLPFGIPIGYVERTERETGDAHFVRVFVKPLDELDSLRRVYVIQPIDREGK